MADRPAFDGGPRSVSPTGLVPALLVHHDATGSACADRVDWLCRGAGQRIRSVGVDAFDADDLTDLLEEVGANDTFLIIHFVGPLVDPVLVETTAAPARERVESTVQAMHRIAGDIGTRYPRMRALHQWAIHAVGQEIDDGEAHLLARLVETSEAIETVPLLRGVLVSATSSHASVTHTRGDQISFCADAASVLLSTTLEPTLASADAFTWSIGSTSITYEPQRLSERLSAEHVARVIDELLLAPLPSRDPGRAEGETCVDVLDLESELEVARLLERPGGGSVRSRVRLADLDFDRIPMSAWVDVITTHAEMVGRTQLPVVEAAVRNNADARTTELRGLLADAMVEQLSRSLRLASAEAFCAGMRAELQETIDDLASRPPPEPAHEWIRADQVKLRHFLRWLPFGPAVALRVLSLALLALLVIGTVTTDGSGSVTSLVGRPWGRAAAVVILILGFGLYQRRLRRTIAVRNRLLQSLEGQLLARGDALVHRIHLEMLTSLLAWIGTATEDENMPVEPPPSADSLSSWLWWLRISSRELVERSQSGAGRGASGVVTTMSLELPAGGLDEHVEDLLVDVPEQGEVLRGLIAVLRPLITYEGLPVVGPDELELRWALWLSDPVRQRAWTDLGDLLRREPRSRQKARDLLEVDATPAIDDADVHGAEVRHYLVLPDGANGDVQAALFAADVSPSSPTPITQQLTDVITSANVGLAVMVHLLPILDVDAFITDHDPIPP